MAESKEILSGPFWYQQYMGRGKTIALFGERHGTTNKGPENSSMVEFLKLTFTNSPTFIDFYLEMNANKLTSPADGFELKDLIREFQQPRPGVRVHYTDLRFSYDSLKQCVSTPLSMLAGTMQLAIEKCQENPWVFEVLPFSSSSI